MGTRTFHDIVLHIDQLLSLSAEDDVIACGSSFDGEKLPTSLQNIESTTCFYD